MGKEGGREGERERETAMPSFSHLTQVRSISAHGSISNWSNPECIFLARLSLPTENTTPTATPTSEPSDTNSVVGKPPFSLLFTLSHVPFDIVHQLSRHDTHNTNHTLAPSFSLMTTAVQL